jgi:MFS family permease
LGLITGGSIADNLSWRWSQYIVAIIDGVVLILLFASFEETLFPRFLFSASTPFTQTTSSSEIESDGKEAEANTADFSNAINTHDFPQRTLLQALKPWTYYPEDTTTYWQYFRRPFFLLSFPNVIIVSEARSPSVAQSADSS